MVDLLDGARTGMAPGAGSHRHVEQHLGRGTSLTCPNVIGPCNRACQADAAAPGRGWHDRRMSEREDNDVGRAPICPSCGVTALPAETSNVLDSDFVCENADCDAFGNVVPWP